MDGGKPQVIPDSEGHRTTPSIVAFTKTGERLVGHAAKRQALINPTNTITAVKRLIGCKFDHPQVQLEKKTASFEIVPASNGDAWVEVNGNQHSPSQISAFVLMAMKEAADKFLGQDTKRAVITVPAYFNDAQRQATKDAGRIAGLNVLRVINEPTAAALAYGLDKQRENRRVVVYDLGGGTFDVSILSLQDGVFEVMATNGDTYLGGEDFDNALMTHLTKEFFGTQRLSDPVALQRLREACERAKIELDTKNETEINLPYLTTTPDGLPVHLARKLTRNEYEHLTAGLVTRTVAPSRRCMHDAGVTPGSIGSLILVGGMTRMPRVRQQARELFGHEPSDGVDPIEAVSQGAAIQAGVLAGEIGDVLLLDVTPLSLGIETLGGAFNKLIARNTTIPTHKSEIFSTGVDGQTQVALRVFQGERPLAEHNQFLGEFTLVGIPPAPRGTPKIKVTFDIDANGIVNVAAVDEVSGQAHSIKIEPCGGLSPAQIEWMVQEAQRHAATDTVRKARVQAETQAFIVIEDVLANMERFATHLPATDVAETKTMLEDLRVYAKSDQHTPAAIHERVMQTQQKALAMFLKNTSKK